MPRSAEETAAYYEELNSKWEAERKAFWNSEVGKLKRLGGRASDVRGSIELFVEEGCNLRASFYDDVWFVSLEPFLVSQLWALPDGLHRCDFTTNCGRGAAARVFINRRTRGTS